MSKYGIDSDSNINWDYTPKGKFVKTHYEDGTPDGDRGFYHFFKSNPKYNKRMPAFHHI
ncbi:hypothetical protein NU10_00665 [Flavobacterium dauae]|uniref:hypothetical protein n=1 Tax=Flavobacterium dauae TaxID=1563479 RepID=UPI00101B230D|nr:hypothetical protein [Flavobacterium dauae]WLD23935.1 hypothetical protein NU10_00665 [Flavobacterium dauae]